MSWQRLTQRQTNSRALGRIEKIHVAPPHEPATIKRCIAKAEGKPIYAYADLYQDISADTAMINGYYLSLEGGVPGVTVVQMYQVR
ncbi:hypothetical protein B0H10DRAFT_2218681 [Mycena sp. CBHHK59/15]|nr:hypothetical protein B0H10DRAFT_2218681 [Mycena sp. CBHHK59/15]